MTGNSSITEDVLSLLAANALLMHSEVLLTWSTTDSDNL